MLYKSNILIVVGYFALSLISFISFLEYYKKGLYIYVYRSLSLSLASILLGLLYVKQMTNDLDYSKDISQRYLRISGYTFYLLYIIISLTPYIKEKVELYDYIGLIAYTVLLYVIINNLSIESYRFGMILLICYFIVKGCSMNTFYKVLVNVLLVIGLVFYLIINYREQENHNINILDNPDNPDNPDNHEHNL